MGNNNNNNEDEDAPAIPLSPPPPPLQQQQHSLDTDDVQSFPNAVEGGNVIASEEGNAVYDGTSAENKSAEEVGDVAAAVVSEEREVSDSVTEGQQEMQVVMDDDDSKGNEIVDEDKAALGIDEAEKNVNVNERGEEEEEEEGTEVDDVAVETEKMKEDGDNADVAYDNPDDEIGQAQATEDDENEIRDEEAADEEKEVADDDMAQDTDTAALMEGEEEEEEEVEEVEEAEEADADGGGGVAQDIDTAALMEEGEGEGEEQGGEGDGEDNEEMEVREEPSATVSGGKRKRGPAKNSKTTGRVAASRKKMEEDVCFICFDGGDLVLCDRR